MVSCLCAFLASVAPLRIVPNKIVYPLNEAGYATVVVTNRDQTVGAKECAVVTETWGIGEKGRTVWTGEIVLAPGEGRAFRIAWPGSGIRYGHELRVTVGGKTRAEYFNVNDDWWRVNQGCPIETPRDTVTPGARHLLDYYGFSPRDWGTWQSYSCDRWQRQCPGWGPFLSYNNLETRWQMQLASVGGNRAVTEKPDAEVWNNPNAGGGRTRRTGDIRRDTDRSHDWGFHHTRYTINFTEGPYGFELARRHPELVLRNERGQYQGLYGSTAPTDIADLQGRRRHPWTYLEVNFFREDVLEGALRDLVDCVTNLQEDGVYFDGRYLSKAGYDCFGRNLAKTEDVTACAVRNMRRTLERIFAANPKAYVWSNGSSRTDPAMTILNHPQSGLLHEVQWPFLMNPARQDHSCRGYLDVLLNARNSVWLPGPYAAHPSKILHNGYLSPRWDADFQRTHAECHVMAQHVMAILASVAAHPFAGGLAMRSFKQMMTRYSEFFWHEDLEIVKDGYRRFVADSLREIWCDDTIYRRVTRDYTEYCIHLVNVPEREAFDDAVTDDPPEADDVEVSTKDFGPAGVKAWVIKPYAWLASTLEPACTPVAAQTVGRETVFRIPPFRYYSLLVVRVPRNRVAVAAVTREA